MALVDTVGADEQTNAQVAQSATVTASENMPAELLTLLEGITRGADYKVVVFFVTARPTRLQP